MAKNLEQKVMNMDASHLWNALEKLSNAGLSPGVLHRLRTDETFLAAVMEQLAAEDLKVYGGMIEVEVDYLAKFSPSSSLEGIEYDFKASIWKELHRDYRDRLPGPIDRHRTIDIGIVHPDYANQPAYSIKPMLKRRQLRAVNFAEMLAWVQATAFSRTEVRQILNPQIGCNDFDNDAWANLFLERGSRGMVRASLTTPGQATRLTTGILVTHAGL